MISNSNARCFQAIRKIACKQYNVFNHFTKNSQRLHQGMQFGSCASSRYEDSAITQNKNNKYASNTKTYISTKSVCQMSHFNSTNGISRLVRSSLINLTAWCSRPSRNRILNESSTIVLRHPPLHHPQYLTVQDRTKT